jgi:hypothetical protein
MATAAQARRWQEVRGKRLVFFDYSCTTRAVLPRGKLDKIVRAALRKKYVGYDTERDRAFAFDLNGDRKPEYFVPLFCGAVGNCTWGVFALNPARQLGVVNGEYIYVHKRAGRLPDIVVYYHMNVAEGGLLTYGFIKRKYVVVGGRYGIGDHSPTETEGLTAHKLPAFLKKAHPACADIGFK